MKFDINNFNHMNKTKQSGFTLIELLVVIAIIGLLSTIAIVSLNGARKKSRVTSMNLEVEQYIKALNLYYDDNGYYPIIPYMNLNGTSICLGNYAPAETYCGKNESEVLADQDFEVKLEKYIPAMPKSVANCPGAEGGQYYNYTYFCSEPASEPADSNNQCENYYIQWALETSDQNQCKIMGGGFYIASFGDNCIRCVYSSERSGL